MTDRIFLGVDLGAESGRVMAGAWNGARLHLHPIHRFPNGSVPLSGSLRWNILGLWSGILEGLSKGCERFGNSVVSVGVDTWGVDYVLLSKQMELLGNPYHYRDGRTRGGMERAFARVSREEIFDVTGVQFMEINTLYQLLAFRDYAPKLLETASRLLMMPDYFHWCLCGSECAEYTNATTTQFVNIHQENWAFDLLEKLGLPSDILPSIVPPGSDLGMLLPEVSDQTGLRAVRVIAPATHDTASAVAAVPFEKTADSSRAYISSGTWSLVGVEVRQAVLTDLASELNFSNEGGIDHTYRLLKNVMGLWLVQQCGRSCLARGEDLSYADLTRLACEAAPFHCLINPDHERFLSPRDIAAEIQAFCRETSQPMPELPGELARCVLESLALKYRCVMESLEQLTGTRIELIHVVGGGSQNDLLNQLTANACGVPVISGPVEATVMGNLLVQARTNNELDSLDDMRAVVRESTRLGNFEPSDQPVWEEASAKFRMLCRQ